MKRILVPCDFSDQAVYAFRSAVSFSSREESEIHLLHVIELPVLHDAVLMPVLSYEENLFRELETKAKQEFEKMVEGAAVPVKTKVVFGATSRMILDFIKETHIDLVIMGTKGATGLKDVFIGSNTERIVRNSPVPVLVVRSELDVSKITDIVFPNTLDTENQENLITNVKKLQEYFGAKLHIVWINTPTNFTPDHKTRDRLNKFCSRFLLKNYSINIYNDVYEESGVINFAHSIDAGLIAMGTHGRKGLAHFFAGSLAEDIVNHFDSPIWTYILKNHN